MAFSTTPNSVVHSQSVSPRTSRRRRPDMHDSPLLCSSPPKLVLRLQQQLRTTKTAVLALKRDKEVTEQKLVQMHTLCERERASQREVVDTARTVVESCKKEKLEMRKRQLDDRKKYSDRAKSERAQRKAAEAELDRQRLHWRQREAAAAETEMDMLSSPTARGAIHAERTQLHAQLAQAETALEQVYGEMTLIEQDAQKAVGQLSEAFEMIGLQLAEASQAQREAELKLDAARSRSSRLADADTLDKATLKEQLGSAHQSIDELKAQLAKLTAYETDNRHVLSAQLSAITTPEQLYRLEAQLQESKLREVEMQEELTQTKALVESFQDDVYSFIEESEAQKSSDVTSTASELRAASLALVVAENKVVMLQAEVKSLRGSTTRL